MFVCLFYKNVGGKGAGNFVPLVFQGKSSLFLQTHYFPVSSMLGLEARMPSSGSIFFSILFTSLHPAPGAWNSVGTQ